GLPAGGNDQGQLAGHHRGRSGGPGHCPILRGVEGEGMTADVDGGAANGQGRMQGREVPDIPAPDFSVLEVRSVPRAASPALAFELRVRDYSEREVYAIALRTQIMIEARQRAHDDATRERLLELFGEPERWGDT